VNRVIAQVNERLQLVVGKFSKQLIACLYEGNYPQVRLLAATSFEANEARVALGFTNEFELWLGKTQYQMPFFELLKVADFLQIEIPGRDVKQAVA
jgi:hypothetical protein